jgi:membrane fusion protein (multidrug efflux system)
MDSKCARAARASPAASAAVPAAKSAFLSMVASVRTLPLKPHDRALRGAAATGRIDTGPRRVNDSHPSFHIASRPGDPASPARARQSRIPMHVRNRAALLAVALSVVLSGCGGPQGGPPAGDQAVPVTVVTLKEEPVTLVRDLAGRTSAWQVADVRPQVTGIVKERLFREGSEVQAGQPLYQLDDATYRADYGVARANLERAEATVEVAKLRAERYARLAKTGVVSAQDNDDAQAALLQARAELASTRASLDSASVQLAHARITAPITGRIGKSAVTPGALVKAAQDESLATIQQLDPMYVDVMQSSAELLDLRRDLAGQAQGAEAKLPVEIYLEDGSRYPHDGVLEFADVSVDPGTGSYLLRVRVPNPDRALLPGMYVRTRVGSGVRPNGVLAPQQGITRDPRGNATALVVGADGKVALREVKVSRTVGDRWLVDGGLAAGDKVIVEGLQKVQPGATAAATEAGAAPPQAPAAGPAAGH